MKYMLNLALALAAASPLAANVDMPSSVDVVAGVDDNSRIRALLGRAKALMDQGNYAEAKDKLETILDLQPGHSEALSLLDACNRQLERVLQAERSAYNAACAKGTTQALRQFIVDYPSSELVAEAQLRIDDYTLWESAKTANTIEAYQSYITSSKVKAYRMEAEQSIKKLEQEQDWQRVKDSDDIDVLEAHISKYPDSPGLSEARWRINWLKGEAYFAQGNKASAMDYYSKARDIRHLPAVAQSHYEQIMAEQEYERMMQSTDEMELRTYLSGLSMSSDFRNPISNKIALLKARKLGQDSDEGDYRDAMDYATDRATADRVTEYIDQAKTARRQHRRYMRRLAHEMWWERNLKFGWNVVGMDFWENFSSLRTGLRIKLGTHQDVFNIQVGADYVWNAFTDSYKDNAGKSQVSFDPICHQIAVPLNVKFNFTNGDNKCSFYIGVAGEYGYTFAETSDYTRMCNESTLAIEPQMGFNWKHADLGFYWRKYLDGKNLLKKEYGMKDQRAGMFLTVYF